MNKKYLEKMLHIFQAYVEGKQIQFKVYSPRCVYWKDLDPVEHKGHEFPHPDFEYRVKPETKIRPWKMEEVPVGKVVVDIEDSCKLLILGVCENEMEEDAFNVYLYNMEISPERMLEEFEMEDGSPCGVEA